MPPVVLAMAKVAKDPYLDNSLDSGVDGLRDSPNNSTDDIPSYIIDPTTRTTYLKGKFLGKGGFARVHEVKDMTTNVTYAGKIIPKSRITKQHHKEKIEREIDVHRHLRHQNIVRFHHCFEDDDNVYIILENCPRKSLVHVLKHRKTLTEPEVRYYMYQLVEGVRYIHQKRVIHRDLKLGNMLLTEDMMVKIGDFGLATRVDGTQKITICGTPNYIAPEVLNKLGHHYEADTWALGCIMYAMLVGHPPFETSTLKETYYRIANNKYILPPSLSPPAANLLRVLLHPSRSCRPTLSAIQQHNFFNSGYMPKALSTWCCTVPPKFPTSVMITRPTSLILESPSSVPVVPEENRIRLVTTSFSRISLINGTANQGTSTHPVGVTNGGTTGVTCLSSTNSSSGNSSSSSSGNGGSSSSGNLQKSSSSSPPPQSTAMCSVSSAGNCVGLKKMSGVPSTCSSVSSSQSQCYVSSSTTNTTNSSSSSRKVSRSQSLKRETCVTCTRSRLSPSPPSNIPSTPPSSSSNNAPGSTGTPSPIVTSPWWHYSRQEPPKKPINGQHTRQHSASSAGPSPLETYSQKMFDAIVDGLDKMPEETNDNPPSIPITPVYISKWIDYSNKYGFGFQLSDHSVGVLFNDNTRMSCSSDKTYVEFRNSNGSLSVHPAHSVPSSLQERFTLLRYFVQYMDENLMEGGDPLRRNLGSQMTPPPRGTTGDPLPQMKRWVRSQKATVMQLTNGTVQVNFFKDHTKLVILEAGEGVPGEYHIMYVDGQRRSKTFSLSSLKRYGCDHAVRERLQHAMAVLAEFIERERKENNR